MVTGQTNATSLQVLGRELHIDDGGRFVFGLGRDTKSPLAVALTSPSGVEKKQYFEVEQRHYDLQKIDGVAQKYVTPPAEVLDRIHSDSQAIKKVRARFRMANDYASAFIWPAEGRISGVYGSQRVFNGVPKRPHYGIDIAAKTGTPVIAPADGLVVLVRDMYYSGWTLVVDHGRGISSTFIHLNNVHVSVGQSVEQGAHIADIGATGRVTGPHLDWRMNWFEQRLDPQLLLSPRN